MEICKGCNNPKGNCECGELKERLEHLFEECIEVSERLQLNFNISVQNDRAALITWFRGIDGKIDTNKYFNMEEK